MFYVWKKLVNWSGRCETPAEIVGQVRTTGIKVPGRGLPPTPRKASSLENKSTSTLCVN